MQLPAFEYRPEKIPVLRDRINYFLLFKLHLDCHVPQNVFVQLVVPRVIREQDRNHGTVVAFLQPLVSKRLFERYPLLAVECEKAPDEVLTC